MKEEEEESDYYEHEPDFQQQLINQGYNGIPINGANELFNLNPQQLKIYLAQFLASQGKNPNLVNDEDISHLYGQVLNHFNGVANPAMINTPQNMTNMNKISGGLSSLKSPNIFSGASIPSSGASVDHLDKSGIKRKPSGNVGFTKSPLIKKDSTEALRLDKRLSPNSDIPAGKKLLFTQKEILRPQEVDISELARTFAKAIGN